MLEEYSEVEKEQIRTQLREEVEFARKVAVKHGAEVHPRVAAIKASAYSLSDDR